MDTRLQPSLIRRSIRMAGVFCTLLALAACAQATAAPTPTPTITMTPTNSPTPTSTPFNYALKNWVLKWSDEFNQPDGSGVDETKWTPSDVAAAVNGELEYYSSRLDNVYIENPTGKNGVLVLKALEESFHGREYTSGKITTSGKFQQTYGRFEALIKIPYGQGIWPAFWLLSTSGGWPFGGEMDIMENIGMEPSTVHGTIHGPGYSGGNGIGAPFTLDDGRRFADDYYLFALEWEPNVLRFYVNNTLYKTTTPADLPPGTEWVYDHDFYIILNVAVGGGWPGYPDATSEYPQTMKVDYVRVYERPGGWPTSTPKPTETPRKTNTPTT